METSNILKALGSAHDPIWIRSTFTLHRNLQNEHFPPKMEKNQFEKTYARLKEALFKNPLVTKPIACTAKEMSPRDKELVFEHFLCLEGFQDALPGQGVVFDETCKFLSLINMQDHLKLHFVDSEGSWESAFNLLSQIEVSLGEALGFAFNPKFGYLTSDKGLAGTGLVAHIYLHLPSLIHTGQIEEVLLKYKEEEVSLLGLKGSLENLVGDLIILRNTYTLGCNEENILYNLHSMAMRLVALEKQVRGILGSEGHADIKDKIARSYGLLLHSYQLQTKEALDALSLMKLGLSLGFVEGVSDEELTRLIFQARRARLVHTLGIPHAAPEEIPHRRAEFLHSQLKSLQLKI